jgi:hypothetical protein
MTEVRISVGRVVFGEAESPVRREALAANLATALRRQPPPDGRDPASWAEWLHRALTETGIGGRGRQGGSP